METQRDAFQWQRYPEAAALIDRLLDQFTVALPAAAAMAAVLLDRTSSRLVAWLDHLVLADDDSPAGTRDNGPAGTRDSGPRRQVADLGFEPEEAPAGPGDTVYHHPGAIFPRLVLRAGSDAPAGTVLAVAIQVEDVAEFLMANRIAAPIEGSVLSPFRRALVGQNGRHALWVVERRGTSSTLPQEMAPDYAQRYLAALEAWLTRPREWADLRQGMTHTLRLAQRLVSQVGVDTAAWIAFVGERAYWQRRNWAGQVQKSRQDQLGLGWANHDHHTFRSSRAVFPLLIQTLKTLGFRPRERFYAGAEAGWGAQVMEQPVCRFAVFADVDLSPDEAEGDFAHQGLPPRPELGTVGLWCALHGESLLTAGLHHLAARFDFGLATAALAERGVETMQPFSDFSYLRQAFTRGERWPVADDRLAGLMAAGQIDQAQRERFAAEGAVGSHLENIQRGQGFKGFNQRTVSDIIRRTDPRTEHQAA